jgi:hypothetical protein
MTRLDANDAMHVPLSTDYDVERRVGDLLQAAVRRQWWTLYLDADDVQRPVVMPMAGYPERPDEPSGDDRTAAELLANRLASIVEQIDAAKVIFVWERPGGPEFMPADVAWARALGAACRVEGVVVRAQLILHSNGVRWLAPDDFA